MNCTLINVINDTILENNETVAISVLPSSRDSAVVRILSSSNESTITIGNDDGLYRYN